MLISSLFDTFLPFIKRKKQKNDKKLVCLQNYLYFCTRDKKSRKCV